MTEAQKRAQARYDAKATQQFHLKLNLKTDADVIARLMAAGESEGKQAYIKRLIREDIARG